MAFTTLFTPAQWRFIIIIIFGLLVNLISTLELTLSPPVASLLPVSMAANPAQLAARVFLDPVMQETISLDGSYITSRSSPAASSSILPGNFNKATAALTAPAALYTIDQLPTVTNQVPCVQNCLAPSLLTGPTNCIEVTEACACANDPAAVQSVIGDCISFACDTDKVSNGIAAGLLYGSYCASANQRLGYPWAAPAAATPDPATEVPAAIEPTTTVLSTSTLQATASSGLPVITATQQSRAVRIRSPVPAWDVMAPILLFIWGVCSVTIIVVTVLTVKHYLSARKYRSSTNNIQGGGPPTPRFAHAMLDLVPNPAEVDPRIFDSELHDSSLGDTRIFLVRNVNDGQIDIPHGIVLANFNDRRTTSINDEEQTERVVNEDTLSNRLYVLHESETPIALHLRLEGATVVPFL